MLTLIVPGLVWTRQALSDLTCDLPLPALTALLGRGRLNRLPPQEAGTMLAELAGLTAPLPAAALRRLARGRPPDAEHWLCLDPVRLRFEQRALIIDDPLQLELTADESAALAVSLAPTFSRLGHLEVLDPGEWNLRLLSPAPAFDPLPEATGRSAATLPLDPGYAPWRQAINEAQMLLHAHPVNQARAAVNRPVVNSAWPWGGGRLPEPVSQVGGTGCDALWSDDSVTQGIARLFGIDSAAPPSRYAPGMARRPLALLRALEQPARSGDALAWRDGIEYLEADWLAPALDALRAGRLDTLRLLAPGEPASAELLVGRRDLWKFWRKPQPITALGSE